MFGKNWLAGKLRTALALGLLLLLALPALAAAQSPFPDLIPLPTGFQPEGIATGRGTSFYAGSLSDMGIYRGDLRTGQIAPFTHPAGGTAFTGMKVDPRSTYLFASGGPTGKAWIFDATTGAVIAMFQLAPNGGSFINDVVITRDAAYFTSSFEPAVYRIPLGPGGRVVAPVTAQTITLSGDWQQPPPGAFGAYGLVATPDGRYLIVVNSGEGKLYRVDPATGNAQEIDLRGANADFGDGLLLQGNTLYVVRNQLNQIAVFRMSSDFLSAHLVRTITSANFDVPTTIARFGDYLYAVNAKFGTVPDPTKATYEVVRVRR
jgi:DNA-binding beta-propeller fold protein YncE